MTGPDPNHMIKFCDDVLPNMLSTACGVDVDLAHRIGADVLTRAEALATLSTPEQDVLIAPFVEEVFDHKPLDASLEIRAKVTVVVRNSLLEQAHHDGPLTSGIITATEYATGPLSHFLAARRREPVDYRGTVTPAIRCARTGCRTAAARRPARPAHPGRPAHAGLPRIFGPAELVTVPVPLLPHGRSRRWAMLC